MDNTSTAEQNVAYATSYDPTGNGPLPKGRDLSKKMYYIEQKKKERDEENKTLIASMKLSEATFSKSSAAMATYFENANKDVGVGLRTGKKEGNEESFNEMALMKAAELLMSSTNPKTKRKGEKMLEKYASVNIKKLDVQLKASGGLSSDSSLLYSSDED